MKTLLTVMVTALLLQPHAAAADVARAQPVDTLARDAEMIETVRKIMAMIGLRNQVTVVIEPGAPGCAYATTVKGAQYIGVDPGCVGPLKTGEHYNWRAVGILTHEIGHLLGGHTTNQKADNPIEESEADEWSGWAMFRLGATLDEALTAARSMDEDGGATHPGRAVRITSVASGWRSASRHTRPQWLHLGPGWWQELMKTPLPWPWPERP